MRTLNNLLYILPFPSFLGLQNHIWCALECPYQTQSRVHGRQWWWGPLVWCMAGLLQCADQWHSSLRPAKMGKAQVRLKSSCISTEVSKIILPSSKSFSLDLGDTAQHKHIYSSTTGKHSFSAGQLRSYSATILQQWILILKTFQALEVFENL